MATKVAFSTYDRGCGSLVMNASVGIFLPLNSSPTSNRIVSISVHRPHFSYVRRPAAVPSTIA